MRIKTVNIFTITLIVLLCSLFMIFFYHKFISSVSVNETELIKDENNYYSTNSINNGLPKNINNNCFSIELAEPPTLYPGIPNLIEISTNGLPLDSITLFMQNARIEYLGKDNLYRVFVSKIGNSNLIIYKKIIDNDSIKLFEKVFKTRSLPMPENNFTRMSEITKDFLLSTENIRCFIPNLSVEIFCETLGFTIIAYINNSEITAISGNNKFTQSQIELIKKIQSNNHLIIKDMRAKLPDGTIRTLPPVVLKIK